MLMVFSPFPDLQRLFPQSVTPVSGVSPQIYP
jgi:hypothetical protein